MYAQTLANEIGESLTLLDHLIEQDHQLLNDDLKNELDQHQELLNKIRSQHYYHKTTY